MNTAIIGNPKRVWKKEDIQVLLTTDLAFARRSLVKLYERQTVEEKITQSTGENNGKGFNGHDANILTKLTEFYLQKGYLSTKQMAIVSKRIYKYAGQLAKIANEMTTVNA